MPASASAYALGVGAATSSHRAMMMALGHTLLLCAVLLLTVTGTALWVHRRQMRAIERALYCEAVSLRFQAASFAVEFARRHNRADRLDEDFFARWRLSPPMIYPVSARDLGFLSSDVLDRLGYFHAQLGEARRRLVDAQASGDFASPYRLLNNLVRASNGIEPWIRGYEQRHGAPVGHDIEFAEARALLELFEDAQAEPLAHPWCWADSCMTTDSEESPHGG